MVVVQAAKLKQGKQCHQAVDIQEYSVEQRHWSLLAVAEAWHHLHQRFRVQTSVVPVVMVVVRVERQIICLELMVIPYLL
jgi:hypothetical protein